MKLKSILLVIAISATTAILSVWGYGKWMQKQYAGSQEPGKLPVNYAGFFDKDAPAGPVDFTAASNSATPAVVHIKTRTKAKQVTNNLPNRRSPFSDFFGDEDPFSDFFGGPRVQMQPEQRASGSGVLISEDGYIVTNNHVVEGADELNVTLSNKKNYKATVIGRDPSSDLAVIKIEGSRFPYMVYGNSDDTKLGQWVLAVGYPLNLDVTITAGIISAKARAIGVNKDRSAVESFIQTDAAVNPGNSGGALINTNGELIGINSAIASPTGSYAGYSYAIPVNIVKKIVNDIIKYGAVQRGYIGIEYGGDNMSDEQRKELGIKDGEGVYVTDVPAGGAAKAAGLQKGDFITKINGTAIQSGAQLQEQVARYKPGDKVAVTYLRNGKEATVNITLKNRVGTYDLVKNEPANIGSRLGGDLATIDKAVAQKNGIPGGVIVKKITGNPLKSTRMQEGFVITRVNGQDIKSLEELTEALKTAGGQVQVEGIYPGYEGTYGYPLNLSSSGEQGK
ncbi:Do family serine endopeptidase [Filimonas effusa]|uniref:Do family serine endopeptidase n=1 Tax=Filimonas effusa TaxID=2508721 RepID=A0A4Q1D9X5_9BACT|nr:Do family serine endopeptidase [Filimonas effusa]RXK85343.1 Do family serine endopeptidase [Filimonas effusa]